jgi:Icc protein
MQEIKLSDHTAPLSFIQITDTHLMDGTGDLMHGISTRETLEAVLHDALQQYPDIDFILFTGDISQTGSRESYVHFHSAISQYNKPVYAVPGNHDTPEYLQGIIPSSPNESLQTVGLGNFTLILLNSYVAGHHSGKLNTRHLQQLDNLLGSSDGRFHIIAIHHPPTLTNSKWLDELGLINRDELLDIIRQHKHRTLLLCGHVHQPLDQQLENIRLLATPSTCYQFVAQSETVQLEEKPRPSYRYIRLNTNREIHTEIRSLAWSSDDQTALRISNL